MAFKYHKSISDLLDSHVPPPRSWFRNKYRWALHVRITKEKLIHAYELGYKHATEEEQPDPALFDAGWEQDNFPEDYTSERGDIST